MDFLCAVALLRADSRQYFQSLSGQTAAHLFSLKRALTVWIFRLDCVFRELVSMAISILDSAAWEGFTQMPGKIWAHKNRRLLPRDMRRFFFAQNDSELTQRRLLIFATKQHAAAGCQRNMATCKTKLQRVNLHRVIH